MDQALFEGFVTRDPLGFFLVGPPDSLEQRGVTSRSRCYANSRRSWSRSTKSIVIDAGRDLGDEWCWGRCKVRRVIFLVITQEFPAIRNAQRYMANLMHMGFTQDQIKIVVNHYQKRSNPNYAALDQIQQTLESAGVLRHSQFARCARGNQQGHGRS